ncbi:MAG: CoA transferase [Candidatus Nitrosopolaris sp.]
MHGSVEVEFAKRGTFVFAGPLLVVGVIVGLEPSAGYQERHGLTAEELCSKRPGLIHAKVTLHGETGAWSNRTGFDETAGAVTGVFALEGTPNNPQLPPIRVVCDYIASWLTTASIMSALRRRAVEGGSYRVVVSLTRVTMVTFSRHFR